MTWYQLVSYGTDSRSWLVPTFPKGKGKVGTTMPFDELVPVKTED